NLIEGKVAVQVRVADTGIGVDEKNFQSIFGKYMQADRSITRQYGGTGLGLAIVKKLKTAMDGEIWVSRNKDAATGTVLICRLYLHTYQPTSDGPCHSPTPAVLPVSESSSLNVAIIGHYPTNIRAL